MSVSSRDTEDIAINTSARWIQLGLGMVAMMAISSPQYVWTLFVKSFQSTTGATLPAIQVTFSLLIVLQTWFSPAQGWLVDRFGPKLLIAVGGALSGLGWVLSANVTSLTGLYLTYGLFCGIGTGIVYVGIIGLMVRWFPDRRGFATGMVAAGYGFGAIIFVIFNAVFFVVAYNTLLGVSTIPYSLRNAAASLGAGKWALLTEVLLPGALPNIVTGIRTGLGFAWRGLIAAEMIATNVGLGYMLFVARDFYRTEVIVLGMIVIGVLWLLIDRLLLVPLERSTIERWGMVRRA